MQKSDARTMGRAGFTATLFAFTITLFGQVDAGRAAENDVQLVNLPLFSILRKLDFSKVALRVRTQPQFEAALRDRALTRLKEHNLKPVEPTYQGPVEAVLILTIDRIPLEGVCSGKFLYDTKLELEDDISLRRDPHLVIQRVTWSFGPAPTSVVDKVSLESLLSDVDRCIHQFIVAY
jgi:hypothetical protein